MEGGMRMADREKVIDGLCNAIGIIHGHVQKRYWGYGEQACRDAIELLKEQEKEIKALRLLVEWATDCDFGFDQFPEEYERYKDEITDMKYNEGMIHVAKRTLEDHGAFEEGR